MRHSPKALLFLALFASHAFASENTPLQEMLACNAGNYDIYEDKRMKEKVIFSSETCKQSDFIPKLRSDYFSSRVVSLHIESGECAASSAKLSGNMENLLGDIEKTFETKRKKTATGYEIEHIGADNQISGVLELKKSGKFILLTGTGDCAF